LEGLVLSEIRVLRRSVLRVAFYQVFAFELEALLGTLSSLTFCEFVLELIQLPTHFDEPASGDLGRWEKIDKFLQERFAKRGELDVIHQEKPDRALRVAGE
jgi:hypothetical protein